MIARRVRVTVIAVAVTVLMLATGAITPVRAAPQPASPARARLAAAVSEGAKVTLPETSIAGPGFDGGEIGWTGTDPAHRLNVSFQANGMQFPTKVTLPDTSPFGPAIAPVIDRGSQVAVLAWTGTDPAHSLNVEIAPGGAKLTLHEFSIGRPAMDYLSIPNSSPTTVLLAWTGTDPNHSLNLLPIRVGDPPAPAGPKVVLRQFSSDAGPSLRGSLNTAGEVVLGWSVRGTQRLNLATSTDGGATFTGAPGGPLPETSAFAPQFVQTASSGSTTTAGCIAWTGTDPANHLNVQCTTAFPQFPNPAQTKTVLNETAFGAPAFTGAAIAWTGTDPAHHLNVAQLTLP